MPNQTEAVLQRHLQAAGEGVDAVMEDYVDESVVITHEATHRGRVEIRRFFTELLEGGSKGFINAFKMNRQEVAGEVAYILWEAKPWFPFATDTLVVRNGKILLQTFAASK
jgi:ketosteroid isomerase-like protein